MKNTPDLVPVTYARKARFTEKDFRLHAGLLADKIESLPPKYHRQRMWTAPARNQCGTTGCALGIAALSQIIPGLQFKPTEERGVYAPTIDGKVPGGTSSWMMPDTWQRAGNRFFGNYVTRNIFSIGRLTRVQVIQRLRNYASHGSIHS